MLTWRKILVPVDFSDTSREALWAGCELAGRFESQVTLLHVYQMPGFAFPDAMVFAGPDVLQGMLSEIGKALDGLKAEAEGRGVRGVVTSTAMGAPFAEILRVADEGKFDLIVMGTHGRTALKHALVGSVAERVVRQAPCPVLTVRPGAKRGGATKE